MEALHTELYAAREPGEVAPTFQLPDLNDLDETLCPICRRIDFRALVAYPNHLRETANLGLYVDIRRKSFRCRFCKLVVTAITRGWSTIIDWDSCSNLELTEVGISESLGIKVYPIPPEAKEAKRQSGLVELTTLDMLAEDVVRMGLDDSPLFHTRLMPESAVDPGQMKEWLDICNNFHGDYCGKEISDNLKRTPECLRLIDIEDMSLVPAIVPPCFWRKSFSKKPPPRRRFVALSYVWGLVTSVELYQTTVSDFSARCEKNSLRSVPFPRTIQDAITTTRLLGERYLWVDSVCIIQDSPEDKAAQISSMHVIYGGAYLTITAAPADTLDNPVDANFPMPRCSPDSPSPANQLITNINGFQIILPPPSLLSLEITPSISPKWFSRGWTWQERKLSTRLMFFTEHQVYFQCRIAGHQESTVTERHSPDLNSHRHEGGTAGNTIGPTPYIQPSLHGFLQVYTGLVEKYSARELGFDNDALNAFTGVGSALMDLYSAFASQLQLYHGLPGRHLEQALVWQPMKPQPQMPRRASFPSWSWAGWRGEVWYNSKDTVSWMGINGIQTIAELTVPDFYLHNSTNTVNPHATPPTEMEKIHILRPQPWKMPDERIEEYGRPQPPFRKLPVRPGEENIKSRVKPGTILKHGTLEFFAVTVPEAAFELRRGDEHQDGCYCYTYSQRPKQVEFMNMILDEEGVACGSLGMGVPIEEREENTRRERAYVCLARVDAGNPVCYGYDTKKYQYANACCWEVLFVEFGEDGVGERVAAGRVHEIAWSQAEGVEWERVWLY